MAKIIKNDTSPGDEQLLIKDKSFIINDIICVGYNIVNETIISILFGLHQDLYDRYAYISLEVELEYKRELELYRKSGMYIEDLKKDKREREKINTITSRLRSNNLYNVDFTFSDKDGSTNYYMQGSRNIDKNKREIQNYLINDSIYIQIRLFKELLLNGHTINNNIFFDNKLKRISYYTVVFSKLDGTIARHISDNQYKIISHYTFQCGKYGIFKVNYDFDTDKVDIKSIREPLTEYQFEMQYGKDKYVDAILYDNDNVLLIVFDSDKTITNIIRLRQELWKYTNFKNVYNYIFYNNKIEYAGNIRIPPAIHI